MCNSVSLINSSMQRNFSFHRSIRGTTTRAGSKIEFRPEKRFGEIVDRVAAIGRSTHDIATNFSASKPLDIRP